MGSDPRRYATVPIDVREEHAILGFIAAVVGRENRGRVRVLDFGGGIGLAYVHLLKTSHERFAVTYDVIELEWACAEGRQIFEHDPHIAFHASLPADCAGVDIIVAASSIQYIEDYAGLLARLCEYNVRYILLTDLYTGGFPTYATCELSAPGAAIPFWFVNRSELVGILRQGGYELLFTGRTPDAVGQENFPEDMRLPEGRRSAMLFGRVRGPAEGRGIPVTAKDSGHDTAD